MQEKCGQQKLQSKLRVVFKEVLRLVQKQAEVGLGNLCECRMGMKRPVLSPFSRNQSSNAVLRSLHHSTRVCSNWAGTLQGSGALWGSLVPSTPKTLHWGTATSHPPCGYTSLVSLGTSWKLCVARWQQCCQQYTSFSGKNGSLPSLYTSAGPKHEASIIFSCRGAAARTADFMWGKEPAKTRGKFSGV